MKFILYAFTYLVFIIIIQCNLVLAQIGGGSGGYQKLEKPKFAGIPVPTYNESTGFGLGLLGSVYYNISSSDTISPPSSTGVLGYYTTNETYAGLVFQQLYLKEDKFRLMLAAGKFGINFQFYNQYFGDGGGFIDYNSTSSVGLFKGSFQMWNDIYPGIKFRYNNSVTTFDVASGVQIPEETFSGMGPVLTYDSRSNIFSPAQGWNIEFESLFNREFFGSDRDYEIYELKMNHYRQLREQQVLALRVASRMAMGDVPFADESLMYNTDLRGYANGKHRADQKYTAQAEYRFNIHRKWGAVSFAGFGWVVDELEQICLDGILPCAGVGIRYLMISEMQLNVGIDYGVGKDDSSFYFRVGEAF